MKKILSILTIAITLISCEKSDTITERGSEIIGDKFEFDGNHYIFFRSPNNHESGGVTLDPDYLFGGNSDTINYKGNKYVKLN